MLLDMPQDTGHLPQQKIIWLKNAHSATVEKPNFYTET
jgi:hypothetical protein